MGVFARALEALTLEPIFGPQFGWSPGRTCRDVHPRGEIPRGSKCCCMARHCTGVEGHPKLRETAAGKLRINQWLPPEQADGTRWDQWSQPDADAKPVPTIYTGPAGPRGLTTAEKRALKRARRDAKLARPLAVVVADAEHPMTRGFLPTMDPDQINQHLDRAAAAG